MKHKPIKGAPSLTLFHMGKGDGRLKFGIDRPKGVVASNLWGSSDHPEGVVVRWCVDLRYYGELPKKRMNKADCVAFFKEKLALIDEILSDWLFTHSIGIDMGAAVYPTVSPFQIFVHAAGHAEGRKMSTLVRDIRANLRKRLSWLGTHEGHTFGLKKTIPMKRLPRRLKRRIKANA